MRRVLPIGVITAAVVGLALSARASNQPLPTFELRSGAWGGAAQSRAPAPPDAHRRRQLLAYALSAAKFNGDRTPGEAVVYGSTREFANEATSGDSVNSDQPVYVLVVAGSFVAYGASPPAGAPLPRGHVLVGILDARTLAVTDWGLGDRRPDTRMLGRGVRLRA